MIHTAAGLPNTCHDCGAPCAGLWWAQNIDAARAGGGVCQECYERVHGPPRQARAQAQEAQAPAVRRGRR